MLDEVISVTEAMRANCRSSGVATAEAMISGLAPGNDADTLMVGKSTCGKGDTGRSRKATAPARAMAIGQKSRGNRPSNKRFRNTHTCSAS